MTRCTFQHRARDGSKVECSDVGMWTLDKGAKTWRPVLPTDRSRRCWAHGPGAEAKPHGARYRRVMPNARLNRVAGILEQMAPETTKALEEIVGELGQLGFPSSGHGGSSYLDAPDPVAGDAIRIAELTGWREDLRDLIGAIEDHTNALVLLVARIRRVKHAHGVRLCNENQQGREGSIEWGDPTCSELPTQNGLCYSCYQRERRWRMAHGKPMSGASVA